MKCFKIQSIIFILLILSSITLHANTLNWVGCGISKKSYMSSLTEAYFKLKQVDINLQGGGATRGIRDVANNKADIGGSCRYQLPGSKIEKGMKFEPVAWDALAIITHKDNPINNLSIAQVKKIYSGKITNWKSLGGADKTIKLFTRTGKISGVGYSIRTLIFADSNKEFVSTKQFKSSGPLEIAVANDIDAIAITGVSSARLSNVKILSLNNKRPTYRAIQEGHYALYRPLYITYNPKSKHIKQVKDFIKFAHSRAGHKIMKKNGVIPYLEALHLVILQSRESVTSQRNSDLNITY